MSAQPHLVLSKRTLAEEIFEASENMDLNFTTDR